MTPRDSRFAFTRALRAACAALLAAVLLMATAAPAGAGSWALVNPDGSLGKSRGVVANYREAPGVYRIVFRKSIAKCVPVVTPGKVQTVFAVFESGNEVTVVTYEPSSGVVLDSWFYVSLAC